MYKLARLFIQLGILGSVYAAGMLCLFFLPWSLLGVLYAVWRFGLQRRLKLWKMGTARWADRQDLRGMINAESGLYLGYLEET